MLSFNFLAVQDLNSLSDLYPPGMLVRCTVTSVGKTMDGHQSVKLSINPKDVNKALNTTALRSGMVGVLGSPHFGDHSLPCVNSVLSLHAIKARICAFSCVIDLGRKCGVMGRAQN